MPLYEYQCQKCGTVYEKIQKFSDRPLKKCERCGGKLERLISAPAIQFKGSGWYITDYARKPSATPPPAAPATPSGSDGNKSGDSAGKGEKTADTPKPAPSPVAKESPKSLSKK